MNLAPKWQIKLFITVLGLCGTDFTRNLPLISPQKIWAAMPLIVQTFQMEDATRIHMDQGMRIVELLYAEAFPKHIDAFSRSSIWSQAQVACLVLNATTAYGLLTPHPAGVQARPAQQGPDSHQRPHRVHAQEPQLPPLVLARVRGARAHPGLWLPGRRPGRNRLG